MPSIFALSDDLSGAAETAVAFGGSTPAARVILHRSGDAPRLHMGPLVIDTDSRHLSALDAAAAVSSVISHVDESQLLFKKVDSLLRGNLGVEVGVLARIRPVVFAPTLPALGRTMVNGELLVNGRALSDTDLWHAEHGSAPRAVAELFGHLPLGSLNLAQLRGDRLDLLASLRELLRRTGAVHPIVLADAESREDLDLLAAAVTTLFSEGTTIALAGSSALADAIVGTRERSELRAPRSARVLVVVGSASAEARAQVERLAESGVPVIEFEPSSLPWDGSSAERSYDDTDVIALTVAARSAMQPANAAEVSAGLARRAEELVSDRSLVLTGGETARRVLDALGVDALEVVGEIEHGAVQLEAADGRTIVTRPGSFGSRDSLLAIVSHLTSSITLGKGRR